MHWLSCGGDFTVRGHKIAEPHVVLHSTMREDPLVIDIDYYTRKTKSGPRPCHRRLTSGIRHTAKSVAHLLTWIAMVMLPWKTKLLLAEKVPQSTAFILTRGTVRLRSNQIFNQVPKGFALALPYLGNGCQNFNSLKRDFFSLSHPCWLQQSADSQSADKTPIPSSFSSSNWESSDFAIHIAIADEDAPIGAAEAIENALESHYEKQQEKSATARYSAKSLLGLGSVWYLPAADFGNRYKKPSRLTLDHANFALEKGDYLRIHHNPRRFPAVDLYDWTVDTKSKKGDDTSAPARPVIEYNESLGYIILNKPPECIPVHPTVDNARENIAACLRHANPTLEYVTTPQRLDQNTSGLITLATSKLFSGYYAQLLRHKTAQALPTEKEYKGYDTGVGTTNNVDSTGIQKRYRCLVCLIPPDDPKSAWSTDTALRKLQSYVNDKKLIRHYLEPSVRAPKRFVTRPPADHDEGDGSDAWAECLMRIEKVGELCTLKGNAPSDTLASALWNSTQEIMPPQCQAVVELEVELLTGRTHQVRGQLSAEGYPLVGDVPYGGAIHGNSTHLFKFNNTRLGLQCCELKFRDPDVLTEEKEKWGYTNLDTTMVPSHRWKTFQLDSAWWTPLVQQHKNSMKEVSDDDMTTMAALDIGLIDGSPQKRQNQEEANVEINPEGLPPQAMLSPGRHKYVLIKATDPNTGRIHKWFVKSASPKECGGPYHKDVARDLVEWIRACGYKATVTGGGRILYQPEKKQALVYGFSYGFGKGDHALAAQTIKEWSNYQMDAAYDDSPNLY